MGVKIVNQLRKNKNCTATTCQMSTFIIKIKVRNDIINLNYTNNTTITGWASLGSKTFRMTKFENIRKAPNINFGSNFERKQFLESKFLALGS